MSHISQNQSSDISKFVLTYYDRQLTDKILECTGKAIKAFADITNNNFEQTNDQKIAQETIRFLEKLFRNVITNQNDTFERISTGWDKKIVHYLPRKCTKCTRNKKSHTSVYRPEVKTLASLTRRQLSRNIILSTRKEIRRSRKLKISLSTKASRNIVNRYRKKDLRLKIKNR